MCWQISYKFISPLCSFAAVMPQPLKEGAQMYQYKQRKKWDCTYIGFGPANVHPAALGTQRSFSTSLMRFASTGHLKVLIKGLHLRLLLCTALCRKVPPEMFRHLICLIDTVALFMSLFSTLPDLVLGVTEILSVLLHALEILLLAFKRPTSRSLSGLVPSAICHEGAWSDISAVDAVRF